jgi:hypothetical protein
MILMNSVAKGRARADEKYEQMVRILDEMLEAGTKITARAVARKHPSIGNASTIIRNVRLSDLLATYKARQAEYLLWQKRTQKGSRANFAAVLAAKDQRIKELEGQVSALRVAVIASIKSVGELGGFSRFLRFFDGYRHIREVLTKLEVMSENEIPKVSPPVEP